MPNSSRKTYLLTVEYYSADMWWCFADSGVLFCCQWGVVLLSVGCCFADSGVLFSDSGVLFC